MTRVSQSGKAERKKKKGWLSHERKLRSCWPNQTHQAVPCIFINFFFYSEQLLLIVFKFTQWMYKYKNNIFVFTIYYMSGIYKSIYIYTVYRRTIWKLWSCCLAVAGFGADLWSTRTGLNQTGRRLHPCLRTQGQHLWTWTWQGTWTDLSPVVGLRLGNPVAAILSFTPPAEGCFSLLSKLYVIIQLKERKQEKLGPHSLKTWSHEIFCQHL